MVEIINSCTLSFMVKVVGNGLNEGVCFTNDELLLIRDPSNHYG
jgi:hypothetical protein